MPALGPPRAGSPRPPAVTETPRRLSSVCVNVRLPGITNGLQRSLATPITGVGNPSLREAPDTMRNVEMRKRRSETLLKACRRAEDALPYSTLD